MSSQEIRVFYKYVKLIINREKLGTILEKHCGTPNQSFIREHHPIIYRDLEYVGICATF